MGIELTILGIRKIRDEEVRELFGKTREEIEKSEYFKTFFPQASNRSGYWCFSKSEVDGNSYRSILHMMTPVLDAHGEEMHVIWRERLGYYWHKNPHDRMRIEELLYDRRVHMEWDQSFHVVPYNIISSFMDREPLMKNKHEELIAFLYG